MQAFSPSGFGWRRDVPDGRDYGLNSPRIAELLADHRSSCNPVQHLPESIDLREYFPAADDQGQLHASSSFAVASLVQYFARRALGDLQVPSRLFLYQIAAHGFGDYAADVGAELRTTIKVLVRCGAPPEAEWPYDPMRYRENPAHPFLYSFAHEYRSITYLRLDEPRATATTILYRVKALVAAGFPCTLGFSVPSSITVDGNIPFRPALDAVLGGLAAVIVGYNDERRIGSDRGAFMIRCSWGTRWGEDGYGWLPYATIANGFAADFWTLLRSDWLGSGEFCDPRSLCLTKKDEGVSP